MRVLEATCVSLARATVIGIQKAGKRLTAAEKITGGMPCFKSTCRAARCQGRRGLSAARIGMPAISRAQIRRDQDRTPDAAHRLPRAARRLCRDGHSACRRRDQRGGRRERPQDRAGAGRLGQSADRFRQGRAPDRARQGRDAHRRDFVRLRSRDRAGREPHQDGVHQHRLQFGRAARLELQSVHVPHRGGELDVCAGGRARICSRRTWSRARSGIRSRPTMRSATTC